MHQSHKSEPTVVPSELWVAFFWQNAGRNYLNQTKTEQDLALPTSANGLEGEFGFLPWPFVARLHRHSVILQVTNFTFHCCGFVVFLKPIQTYLGFKVGLVHTQQICQTLGYPQLLHTRCSIRTGIAASTGLSLFLSLLCKASGSTYVS